MTSLQKDILTVREKKYEWMNEVVLKCYLWNTHTWKIENLHNQINKWKRTLSNPFLILYLSKIEDKILDVMKSKDRKIYPEEMKYYVSCLLTDLLAFAEKMK